MQILKRRSDAIYLTDMGAFIARRITPPANRYEELSAPLEGYSSIRVNSQYRLIFIWQNGKANNIYLDDHGYKWHK